MCGEVLGWSGAWSLIGGALSAGLDDFHITGQPCLPRGHVSRDAVAMPDRAFPAVDALIRKVQRVAASRPDPMHILAQTISMTGEIGTDCVSACNF
jgi:hypothetical protein